MHAAAGQVLTALSKAQRSQALQRWRTLRPHVKDAVRPAWGAAHAGVPKRTVPVAGTPPGRGACPAGGPPSTGRLRSAALPGRPVALVEVLAPQR
jgi:hypothetical protein